MSSDAGMDTPLAPIPAPAPPERRASRPPKAREVSRGPGFFTPLHAGVSYALRSWRVLLPVLLLHIMLALTVVMPFQTRLAARLDAHAHGPALSGSPDAYDRLAGWEQGGLAQGVWSDTKRLEQPLLSSQHVAVFWIAIIAWLFGALVNGGYLGTVPDTGAELGPLTFSAFLSHGGRNYLRMLRVGIVFALAYYVLATVVMLFWARTAHVDETWSSTSATAWWGDAWRAIVMLVGFLWMRVAADLARADLVRSGRRSALLAYLRGVGCTLRHPLRCFGLALLVGVPAFLLLLGFGLLWGLLGGGGMLALVLVFVLIQVAVLVRLGARAAVLAGNLALLDQLEG